MGNYGRTMLSVWNNLFWKRTSVRTVSEKIGSKSMIAETFINVLTVCLILAMAFHNVAWHSAPHLTQNSTTMPDPMP